MKHFTIRRLITTLCAAGVVCMSGQALASAFQLWEQDAAAVGNYHAGYAALANDASIAWFNPAGITRFKNQQIVFGASAILSDFKYNGSVTVSNTVPPFLRRFATKTYNNVTAQGGVFSLVPNIHYVAPINDRVGFGLSADVPFGLKTSYGRSTPMRFAATLTSISVIDISPSLGVKVYDGPYGIGSLGAGFDIQKAYAELDNVGLATLTGATSQSTNYANDTGYGYHLGGLYEFTPDTRIGLSYHSQVVHHLSGYSTFEGAIANALNHGGPIHAGHATTKITLPPYTAFTAYHRIIPQVAVMGSIIYTQWNTFNAITLNNVAGAVPKPTFPFATKSTTIQVVIPENYRNSWNYSLGADYYVSNEVTLRGAIGYDETPVRNNLRNAQLPDNNRFVIALGSHFQASKAIGVDLGWTHLFFAQAKLTPPPQVTGAQTVVINGHVNGGADVFGGQVTWDIV